MLLVLSLLFILTKAEAAIFINLSPFFSLVASSLFLGETVQMVQWLGFLLVVIGVLFASGALEQGMRQSLRRKIMG
ncbi:DMT family transporter [Anoxybacillus sp. B2M1]|uniref:DMT family transporter n=1 Tax=Anoxybacillus sp. B2M1 TaxID=1490052 RepID=UPI0021504797|nr:DMT family transporter [Anoxybacillus sp. B2M1]